MAKLSFSLVNEKGSNVGLLLLRIMFGVVMAYHGYGKVFGGHMDQMIQGVGAMGFPAPFVFAWAAALSEFAGGILVAIGFKTRMAALFIFCTMFVAAFVAHAADPFQRKELALAYLVVSAAFF